MGQILTSQDFGIGCNKKDAMKKKEKRKNETLERVGLDWSDFSCMTPTVLDEHTNLHSIYGICSAVMIMCYNVN